MTSNDEYVLQILVERGFLTQEQVEAASKSMRAENETTLDVLVAGGTVGEDEVLGTVADQFGLKYCHVNADAISQDVTKEITSDIAKKYGVVPVVADDESITVALSDPMGYDAIDSLRYVLHGRDVQAVIAPRSEVQAAMAKLYAADESADVQTRGDEDGAVGDDAGDDSAVIKLANLILTTAIKMKASDIHIEPMEKEFRVRYRIDGALRKMDSPPKRLQGAIISRFKIMSKMKISEKRIPQDGRIQISVGGKDLDLRVSSVPTNHGESIVMRILDKSNLSLGLPQLGFLTDDQSTFERLIKLPDGVVLVTGPTGSGKTTTLYSTLRRVATEEVNVSTIEDPIENIDPHLNQTQVQPQLDFSFAEGVRALMRQDPDIIMIGEIRDLETADMAVQAALTGHLVFSTLHTNDATGAFTRLMELGVPPYLLSATILGVLAQRLVRLLCPHCKKPGESAASAQLADAIRPWKLPENSYRPFHPVGCQQCRNTGFKGRLGIYELLTATEAFRALVHDKADLATLRRQAIADGMRPLRLSGALRAAEGVTTLEEVIAATPPLS